MGDKFRNLDSDKQQKIINAALKEFAVNGYELASTNQIVEEAEISKGSLFYYFKTKEELFKYLIEYSMDSVTDDYLKKIDFEEEDLIKMYRKMSKEKIRHYTNNPYVFNFLGTIYLNYKKIELADDLMERLFAIREKVRTNIFDNIDRSLFRDDLPADQVIKLIRWSIEGYQQELFDDLQGKNISEIELESYWDEFDDFLDILRKIYYKE